MLTHHDADNEVWVPANFLHALLDHGRTNSRTVGLQQRQGCLDFDCLSGPTGRELRVESGHGHPLPPTDRGSPAF